MNKNKGHFSMIRKPQPYHTHEDEHGALVKCYHGCKSLFTDWKFIVGVTVSFPIEHFLWTRVPGFSDLAHIMGLIGGH